MLNLIDKDPSLVKKTPAPISMELLQESFTNTEVAFLIDYETSTLRGKKLLTYLGNLDVPCDILVTSKISKEERFELIQEYMESRLIIKCQSLALTVGVILTAVKNIGDFYNAVVNPILDRDEVMEFIQANLELVNRWRVVMDSMIVYTMSINPKYVDVFGHPKEQFHNVDDDKAIGNNFVHLFELDYFMELYYSVLGKEAHYFTKQFEDYMFASQNLFFWFMKPSNPLPGILEAMGSVQYDLGDMSKAADFIEDRFYNQVEPA